MARKNTRSTKPAAAVNEAQTPVNAMVIAGERTLEALSKEERIEAVRAANAAAAQGENFDAALDAAIEMALADRLAQAAQDLRERADERKAVAGDRDGAFMQRAHKARFAARLAGHLSVSSDAAAWLESVTNADAILRIADTKALDKVGAWARAAAGDFTWRESAFGQFLPVLIDASRKAVEPFTMDRYRVMRELGHQTDRQAGMLLELCAFMGAAQFIGGKGAGKTYRINPKAPALTALFKHADAAVTASMRYGR